MQELINQIIEKIQNTNIGTREKSEWIERLPGLDEQQLIDLLTVLNARTQAELDKMQQQNLANLQKNVQDLEKLTHEGVDLLYKRGEEMSREDELKEQERAIEELDTA